MLPMRKIINVPLPNWSILFKAIFQKNSLDKDIIDRWGFKEDRAFLFSRSAWSLDFIAKYRLLIKEKDSINIWIPSYFCNSSLAPLRELKTNLIFYPIRNNGSPDTKAMNDMLLTNQNPDLILAVHYFGKIMKLEQISEIAERTGAWLIEDSAHVLKTKELSPFSHFTLFSPHKFLPIYGGAILSVNDRFSNLDSLKRGLKDYYHEYINSNLKGNNKENIWLIKRIIQKLGINRTKTLNEFPTDEIVMTSKKLPSPRMSQLSKKLLSLLSDSLENEESIRKFNYKAWISFLRSQEYQLSEIFKHSKSNSPYMLGVVFNSEAELASALKDFNINKVPISSWPDLPPEVLGNKKIYGETLQLRLKSLFFPVHSSIREKDIESSSKKYKRT